ncbi:hypothetical protein SDC9_202819 [bioreactor metagenome]|uniref:Uncharacterized protein n=1 Tax=bioreactor metagenome TaxID=1076179 RepID=A0A645IW85_9ZZZZ
MHGGVHIIKVNCRDHVVVHTDFHDGAIAVIIKIGAVRVIDAVLERSFQFSDDDLSAFRVVECRIEAPRQQQQRQKCNHNGNANFFHV